MIDAEYTTNADISEPDRRLWRLGVVLVGAVFFFVGHNFFVSQYERYAPWSDAGETVEAGGNVVKGLALGLIGVYGLWLLLRRNGRRLELRGWLPAMMILYLGWSASSVLWSDDPALSCRRLAVLGFCVLGAAGFARQFRPRDVVIMALFISGAYLLIGVAAETILGTFRPWSSGYRFAGTVHPNTQGAHLTIFCLASFCLARSETKYRNALWAAFALGVLFLLLTKSRTSCAALAIALGAIGAMHLSGRVRLMAVLLAGFAICTAFLAGATSGVDFDDAIGRVVLLGREEQLDSLTGRLPIWTELLDYARAKPLQGYGYGAFWTPKHVEAVSDEMQWPLREAHNAYLDAVLSVGLIGAASFLAAVAIGLFRAGAEYRRSGDSGFAFTVGLLVFGLVNACLETGMMSPSFITFIAGCGVMQVLAAAPRREIAIETTADIESEDFGGHPIWDA